jgi:hypothetical protein
LTESPIPLHRSLLGAILSAGAPQCINNAHLDPRTYYPEHFHPPQEHLIGIPLQLGAGAPSWRLPALAHSPLRRRSSRLRSSGLISPELGLRGWSLSSTCGARRSCTANCWDWLPYRGPGTPAGASSLRQPGNGGVLGANSAAEVLGSPVLEVVAPESRQQALERIGKLYSGNGAPPHWRLPFSSGAMGASSRRLSPVCAWSLRVPPRCWPPP